MSAATPAGEPLRLIAVLAHPDDESLGVGGTLAKYAAEGAETYVVTATRGQAGRFRGGKEGEDPAHPGRGELARIRAAELRAASSVLGVRELVQLGHEDGVLDQADPREVVRAIAGHYRRLKPQVAVTFPPDGAYGHPDHIAVSQFATAAAVAAANPEFDAGPEFRGLAPHALSKLYYMTWPAGPWAAYQEAFKKLVSHVDGVERQAVPWPDWAVTTIVETGDHWPTVWKAVQCHDSQIAGYERLRHLSPEHHEELWGRQYFYRAFSTVNGGRRRETDLFEGLRP
ncbi:MAG TPA: PIG-L family deacetylase [Candidatus Eisenbacteria bacterium]|nr:PIG-L family deacetylase [Candidatus Eisenbacteria bacterium]